MTRRGVSAQAARRPRAGRPRAPPRPAPILADWLRKPDNPFFARALVNRYWKHFFGRGLVEPEDDMRVSNPPSNPELLDALADDFVEHGYDLKHLVRTIATSRAYDRSSLPNAWNGARPPELRPVLRPAAARPRSCSTRSARSTGTPRDVRRPAPVVPRDPAPRRRVRLATSSTSSAGPSGRASASASGSTEANLSQSLHLLNSAEIQRKLATRTAAPPSWAPTAGPTPRRSRSSTGSAYARPPTADEREVCLGHLDQARHREQARQGYEDLIWTLINTKEFLFNR